MQGVISYVSRTCLGIGFHGNAEILSHRSSLLLESDLEEAVGDLVDDVLVDVTDDDHGPSSLSSLGEEDVEFELAPERRASTLSCRRDSHSCSVVNSSSSSSLE